MKDASPQAADEFAGRVLLIDDDALFRFTVTAALQQAGYEVDEAEDGPSGVELFRRVSPDVVLLDILMPGIDGFDVCRTIRRLPNGEAPVIMLTGLDDTDSISQAFEAGATTFFTKPLNFRLLGHRLRYIIRASKTYERLRESEARLAHAQRIASIGHWEWRRDTNIITCSETLCDIVGLPYDQPYLSFPAFLDLLPRRDRMDIEQKVLRAIRSEPRLRLEHRLHTEHDQEKFIYQEAEIFRDGAGRVKRILGIAQDVTERKQAEEKIRFLAYFDPTTGLPNRALMKNLLGHAIDNARRHHRNPAVLFIDIDYFKRINDTFGHDVGDSLLREVADRLVHSLRIGDRVSRPALSATPSDGAPLSDEESDAAVTRLGGDEFVVVLTETRSPESAVSVARRITRALSAPFRIAERDTTITASIGIAVYPSDGEDVDELLKNADAAMYHAKAQGRNCHQFYSFSLHEKSVRKFSLEQDLRRALDNEEFTLHYQPKLDLRRSAIVGMEALLRWQHPSGDLISPLEFVPIAEETGLIVPLGEWVLKTACAQAQAWRRLRVPPLHVAVNLSAAQFRQRTLANRVAKVLRDTGLEPENLVLELTESMLVDDVDLSSSVLRALKGYGVRIAIDDFGTGYSSLNYLRQLPISELKIDRSFVRNVPADADDAAIVNATIALAHSLRLRTVAEGVETVDQLEFLRGMGCDELQGYYISRPLAVDAFETWLRGSTFGEAA